MRRLFFDLETSPNVVLSWRLGRKIDLSHESLIHERAVICCAWKWENEPTQSLHWDSRQNDRAMLAKFLRIANTADELVAHNGARFDAPWLRTRCLFHRLPPAPNWKLIDTLRLAKRHFYFNSNRLDYIAKFLGCDGKLKTDFDLWKSVVLEHDAAALRRMVVYCRHDVEELERVYHKLARWVGPASHVGVAMGLDKWTCPRCGSEHVKKKMTRTTAAGTIQHQMQCRKCGGIYSICQKAHRDYLEAKHR